MGAAAEVSSAIFLSPTTTRTNPVRSSVGTSTVLILNGDPDRVKWVLFNVGGFDMFIGFRDGLSATTGQPVPAGTGFAICEATVDGEEVAYPVFAIAPGGTTEIVLHSTEAVPARRR